MNVSSQEYKILAQAQKQGAEKELVTLDKMAQENLFTPEQVTRIRTLLLSFGEKKVANTQSIQFFLKSEKTGEDILDFLGSTIGFLVESTDVEISNSVGFAQISGHTQGFEQGILVTWPRVVELALTPDEMIKVMAARLDVLVLLETQCRWRCLVTCGTRWFG